MIIEVDCNNDMVTLLSRYDTPDAKYVVNNPLRILKMLEEIFTEMANDAERGLNVSLLKIDEDTRTIIGEW